jgi:hypothetical protein
MDSLISPRWLTFEVAYNDGRVVAATKVLLYRLEEVRKFSGQFRLVWRWPGSAPFCDLLPPENMLIEMDQPQMGDTIIQRVFDNLPTKETLKNFLNLLSTFAQERFASYVVARDLTGQVPQELARYVSG